jgi:hypothetical protein
MMLTPRCVFVTVTDYDFFPGTVATVNSILHFNDFADIVVVQNGNRPLTEQQAMLLAGHQRLRLIGSSEFERPGRHINAWELKAYAVRDLSEEYEVVVAIDSDCLLCSDVDGEIRRCAETGALLGGRDGDGQDYDETYRVYGIATPARNEAYVSTSLLFCAATEANRAVFRRWAECCARAVFNGQGPFPGHGDQGVLNAVLFAAGEASRVELLDNALWSQHWVYWSSIVDDRNGSFLNRSFRGARQRAFHCGGAEKYWSAAHSHRVVTGSGLQAYPYVWYLTMLFFGTCRNWSVDPAQYMPPGAYHLIEDLVRFLPQIQQIMPCTRRMWSEVGDPVIDRVLAGIPRAVSLGGGSLSELIALINASPRIRRYVEVGGYEGGSILAVALRFATRDIDFFSVESFMGNLDGSMDGHRLPLRAAFLGNLARFPTLRARLVPGDSRLAAGLFDDGSIDFLFIDACHDTEAVLADIDAWLPKLAPGAIVGGDDYGWESVRHAVAQRFGEVQVTGTGCIWHTVASA